MSMDYMFLNEETSTKEQPQLVLVDHKHGRMFSYGVPNKGTIGDAEWVANRVIKDIDNKCTGAKNVLPHFSFSLGSV